jgi:hypothetical protein
MKKVLAFLFIISISLSVAFSGIAPKGAVAYGASGSQGTPSDTLTIRVGYFGFPYETKKVYTVDQLLALPHVEQMYSWIDTRPVPCGNNARGVRLSDIIADAGIDINSIEMVYPYCTDKTGGWYEDLTSNFLFDVTRYYYPRILEFTEDAKSGLRRPLYYDTNTQKSLVGAGEDKERVDTIIAVEDAWARIDDGDYAEKINHRSGDSRFRLVFGMHDTESQTASMSAQWIHRIDIQLGGAPPAEETDISAVEAVEKAGSEKGSGTDNPPKKTTNSKDMPVKKDEQTDNAAKQKDAEKKENPKKKEDKKVETTLTTAAIVSLEKGKGDGTELKLKTGAKQPWRIHKIGEDARPMQAPEPDTSMVLPTVIAMAACLLFGGCLQFVFIRRREFIL